MIQGLQFTIRGEEVLQWVKDRAEHHRERAVFYIEQLKKMDEAGIEVQQMTGDAKAALTKHHQDHNASADEFAFMARYIDAKETYRLDRSDLARLGKLRSAY